MKHLFVATDAYVLGDSFPVFLLKVKTPAAVFGGVPKIQADNPSSSRCDFSDLPNVPGIRHML